MLLKTSVMSRSVPNLCLITQVVLAAGEAQLDRQAVQVKPPAEGKCLEGK